ncbi:MAG TPA: CPBP family intramembrane glutamic endopeptidase [Acidimicrobiia bacterium]|nr:CPBP family intramembrane glutamic endopeptidase [Acidimicrobiia bacterium]
MVDTPLQHERIDRQSLIVFVSATVILVVFEYWGLPWRFSGTRWHHGIADALGPGYAEYFPLLPFQYWGVSSVVLRVLVPVAIIVFVLRQRPGDWGFRVGGQWRHLRLYALFLVGMLPLLWLASLTPAFQAKYPFYDLAGLGGWHFWGFQLFYGLQFLGVEAFFRGFMLFGLYARLGYYAIPVMVIPYTMIHFGKPVAETFAAIVAGFILGWIALKSRSFLWGFFLHWAVAITMDLLVIGHDQGFGTLWSVLF